MYGVIRDCCTSGNCDVCHDVTPVGKCIQVSQTGTYYRSPEMAKVIANNFRDYNARVVTPEENERVMALKEQYLAERRKQFI